MFFQSLLRSPTLVRGCKDNLFLFPGKLFGMFFELPLKNNSNSTILYTVLLRYQVFRFGSANIGWKKLYLQIELTICLQLCKTWLINQL